MLVFSKAKLVLLSVPKTGSTAYQTALAPYASMVVNHPPELKHSPVFRYNRYFRPMLEKFVGENLDIVAVMREPLDWLGSWYRYRQREGHTQHTTSTKEISFDAFVEAYCMGEQPPFAKVGSQAKFLEPQRNGTAITHLFRYENQDDLQEFLQDRLGQTFQTELQNVSPQMDLTLTEQTLQKFERKYEIDMDLWNSIGPNGQHTPLTPKPKP